MNAPQIIMIGLMIFGLTLEATKDGQPKTGKHNLAVHLMAVLLNVLLLWWGGFWR